MKKSLFLLFAILVGSFELFAGQPDKAMYKDSKQPVDVRVKDLLSKMTIEEKAGQLNQLNVDFSGESSEPRDSITAMQKIRDGKVGSVLGVVGARATGRIQKVAVEGSRLGIPLLIGYDVIHGYKTIFPIPLAETCSWDLQLIENDERTAAREATSAGIHWAFAPMCDISRDARWGRVMEGAGEDPFLGSMVAAARVKGLQGNLDQEHLLACCKHYAGYGAVEAGRDYNNVDMSRASLWNDYLPPYKAAVEAGVASVMNSYCVVDGIPASGNKYIVTDVLKNKWKFKGFLVSDYASFKQMVDHGFAADKKDAALKAFQAGSEMDMVSEVTVQYLPELVKEGKISMQDVDNIVAKILAVKFERGLFDNPYIYCDEQKEKQMLLSPENRKQAREAAQRTMVLLKNEHQLLPLSKNLKKIAVVGCLAVSRKDALDNWCGNGDTADVVTLMDGLKARKDINAEIKWSFGWDSIGRTNESLINEAVANSKDADVILVNAGITGDMAGEDRSMGNPVLPDGQVELIKALQKTGKPIVVLVSSGRPLVLTWLDKNVNTILQCWIPGTEAGNAITDVLFGDYNPSGKTVMSFPYAVGQIPVYYNHKNTGRPQTPGKITWRTRYVDIPNDPLYPFGYGLSYTTFSYSNLKVSNSPVQTGQDVKASVTVTNTGNRDGEEVVQLYIRDMAALLVRPVKELKGFQKIFLKAGESKTIEFTLTDKDLSYYNTDGDLRLEAGAFKLFVGGDSKNTLETSFEIRNPK